MSPSSDVTALKRPPAFLLGARNLLQDVVAVVENISQLLSIERDAHWAGRPDQKLVLVDAFRSLVREGELQTVSPT